MKLSGSWPRVAVVGAGAVGGYFGGLLADAGAPVVMIGRKAFVEAVSRAGLFLDTLQFQKSVRVEASTELSAVREAELVLFCVKTTDNAATARELASFLSPGAIVVSLQNGVDNVEQIRAARTCPRTWSTETPALSPARANPQRHATAVLVGQGERRRLHAFGTAAPSKPEPPAELAGVGCPPPEEPPSETTSRTATSTTPTSAARTMSDAGASPLRVRESARVGESFGARSSTVAGLSIARRRQEKRARPRNSN